MSRLQSHPIKSCPSIARQAHCGEKIPHLARTSSRAVAYIPRLSIRGCGQRTPFMEVGGEELPINRVGLPARYREYMPLQRHADSVSAARGKIRFSDAPELLFHTEICRIITAGRMRR